MPRRLEGKLVIATHNLGKLAEMRELLASYGVVALAASELGLPEPEETGASFISNAVIKARAAANSAKIPRAGREPPAILARPCKKSNRRCTRQTPARRSRPIL
jgi:hypothetical protein